MNVVFVEGAKSRVNLNGPGRPVVFVLRLSPQHHSSFSISYRSLPESLSVNMCRNRAGEDDVPSNEDYTQSTGNGIGHVDTRIQAQIATLEARIARVEAWLERLEARVLYLRRGMFLLWAVFLVTLAYAIFK
ncbi:hypothetical protein F0562_002664 [Nyssa sinensis]|uniref:Uncharacterized protein n=1 Tax=Nyssa sinensis TaxID=561372 RepID=A0A5J5BY05_9ASTE|nr:hypothetical protein F0562_002664 [Nyssa sinensis]